MASQQTNGIRIIVSACLTGERVRFDGEHARNAYLVETLGKTAELVGVCPEVEIGMSVPREKIRLIRQGGRVELIGETSGADNTESMERFSRAFAEKMMQIDPAGCVLKSESPSCGIDGVDVLDGAGKTVDTGPGMFARIVKQSHPLLPVVDEAALADIEKRSDFLDRVFAYRRLRDLFSGSWRRGEAVRFHTSEKLLVLAHHQPSYRSLGGLVSRIKDFDPDDFALRYQKQFIDALAHPSSRAQHAEVFQMMAGFLQKIMGTETWRELNLRIRKFRRRGGPMQPLREEIRTLVNRFEVAYLQAQTYLDPWPYDLLGNK